MPTANGTQVGVFLTNDLSVGVAGTLTVELIPWMATAASDVSVLWSGRAAAPPLSGAGGWLGDVQLGEGQHPADAFVRLRFCPETLDRSAGYPSPFGSDAAPSSAVASLQLELAGGGGAAAAASDGGGQGPCAAPEMGAGAAPEACAAAARLLQCSEAQVLLTELQEARLPEAEVEVVDVAWREGSGGDGGGGNGSAVLTLDASGVALYVEVQAPPGVAGRWSAAGGILLPWEGPLEVEFWPETAAAVAGGTLDPGHVVAALEQNSTVMWLQRGLRDYGLRLAADGSSRGGAAAVPPLQSGGVAATVGLLATLCAGFVALAVP